MKTQYLIILALFVAFAGCTEKMDIDLNTTNERLVIEGNITSDDTTQYIKLTHSTGFYYADQPPAVQNAVVTVNDGSRDIVFNEVSPGLYASPGKMKGDTLKSYTLDIRLEKDINGSSNYTAQSAMPSVISEGYIEIEYHDDWLDGIWEVQLFAQDPPTENFYLFRSLQNGEMVTDSINEWIISEDRFYNGGFTNGVGVAYFNRKEGQELKKGDTVTVIMSGITEDYYYFIKEVKEEAFGQNPMFSGPPANVSSNINNGGIGFFAAYSNVYFTAVYQGE